MILQFEDIKFHESGEGIRAFFLKQFYFDLSKKEMDRLGKWKLKGENLEIEGKEDIVRRNFNNLLEIKLKELKSLQGKPAIFIHSGFIPLIGSLYFGIIDRNTNIIEIRPITGCNLNCIFCSVDLCRRERDFVVQKDYLVSEFKKLAELKLKAASHIEAHINAQGEPLLYSPLAELIRDISKVRGVKTISIDTNGTLLTKEKIDELVSAGLTRLNVSLNSFSQKTADKISNINYPLKQVIKMIEYAARRCDVLIAPVWLNGVNDEEMEKMIKFALSLKESRPKQKTPFIGIQNFLGYKFGKKPVKQKEWEEFYAFLKKLEEKYKIRLKLDKEDFSIVSANILEKPFKKGQKIDTEIICDGMFKNEKLAQSKNRIIVIPNCQKKEGSRVRVKITRDKYNVFYGELS